MTDFYIHMLYVSFWENCDEYQDICWIAMYKYCNFARTGVQTSNIILSFIIMFALGLSVGLLIKKFYPFINKNTFCVFLQK
jgi:hypothetical protein